MAEKIVVSFSGWCECDPDEEWFVSISCYDIPEVITGREWLALPERHDGDTTVATRDDYVLKSWRFPTATAIDGAYEDIHIEVEDE